MIVKTYIAWAVKLVRTGAADLRDFLRLLQHEAPAQEADTELLDCSVGGGNTVGKYKVTANPKREQGVSVGSFRIGKGEDQVRGRVGDEVKLSDEQVEQLRASGFEFTEATEQEAQPNPAQRQPDNTESEQGQEEEVNE